MKLLAKTLTRILLALVLPCAGNPKPAPDPFLQKVCGESCAGAMAKVIRWYDSTGKIAYYDFSGDLRSCSHPPLILYDSKGREALTIPNQPLDECVGVALFSASDFCQVRLMTFNASAPQLS